MKVFWRDDDCDGDAHEDVDDYLDDGAVDRQLPVFDVISIIVAGEVELLSAHLD